MAELMFFDLMTEVARFKKWADAIPIPVEQRSGEWECDYDFEDGWNWARLTTAVLRFVDTTPFARWSPEEVQAVLYVIARENETECLVDEICAHHPETFIALARAAIACGERDAKWQLAVKLGQLKQDGEPERLLLKLAQDGDEYVRRRSLCTLAELGSPSVEALALAEWPKPGKDQQWTRMGVLYCLHRIGSPHLEPLLAQAERDERPHLAEYAQKLRRGEAG